MFMCVLSYPLINFPNVFFNMDKNVRLREIFRILMNLKKGTIRKRDDRDKKLVKI